MHKGSCACGAVSSKSPARCPGPIPAIARNAESFRSFLCLHRRFPLRRNNFRRRQSDRVPLLGEGATRFVFHLWLYDLLGSNPKETGSASPWAHLICPLTLNSGYTSSSLRRAITTTSRTGYHRISIRISPVRVICVSSIHAALNRDPHLRCDAVKLLSLHGGTGL